MGGPGTLTQALGIRREWSGTPLTGPKLWLEDRGVAVADEHIVIRPRVGIDYAGADAARPYRFRVAPAALAEFAARA
jgi:DNA-3-methyladenine glycosylase